jgi:predicted ATP-dependent endonuclease of OLD family
LNAETKKYFVKLPGYDTLRFILAEKVILVEGPTDDLIIQRAYKDKYGKLPIEDRIDIIVVDSLAFKRHCDIAVLMQKEVVVVTDNDGSIQTSIKDKYADYLPYSFLTFIYEHNEDLNTIEPSVLDVNCDGNGDVNDSFKQVISANGSMMKKSKDEILHFMINNKAEWAFRVFESTSTIVYPEYIKNVIEQYH